MTSMQDPIRLRDYRLGSRAIASVSRLDAQRQFRMSIALLTLLSVGSLMATVATLSAIG